MNSLEFRQDASLREYMQSVVSDPRFLVALDVVKNFGEETDAETTSDPIVSVRLLSQAVGRAHFVRDLKMLAQPVIPPESMPSETFGTKHSVEDFDQDEETRPTPP